MNAFSWTMWFTLIKYRVISAEEKEIEERRYKGWSGD